MRSLPRLTSVNTGSSALSCGLLVALAAVAMVVGIARYDLTRPADHPLFPKMHSQSNS